MGNVKAAKIGVEIREDIMTVANRKKKHTSSLPYPLECNPGLLFSVLGFWVGFYSNMSYLGLYSSWASINYSLMGPEQTLPPLLLFIKFKG